MLSTCTRLHTPPAAPHCECSWAVSRDEPPAARCPTQRAGTGSRPAPRPHDCLLALASRWSGCAASTLGICGTQGVTGNSRQRSVSSARSMQAALASSFPPALVVVHSSVSGSLGRAVSRAVGCRVSCRKSCRGPRAGSDVQASPN
jgi:hypothetical protein